MDSYINKAGETKGRRKILIPFDVPKRINLKRIKTLYPQRYRIKVFLAVLLVSTAKNDYYSVGKFMPGSWGVNDVEDKLHPIIRSHTNDKGHWVKNPNETERKEKADKRKIN